MFEKKEKNDFYISTKIIDYKQSNIPFNENYVSIALDFQDNLIIFFYANKLLISKIISSNKVVDNNKVYFSFNFDVYKIIKKK